MRLKELSTNKNFSCRYYITIEAKKGIRYLSDLAIDDVSLTPECFGINIPAELLQGYSYWNPVLDREVIKETAEDFKNKTCKTNLDKPRFLLLHRKLRQNRLHHNNVRKKRTFRPFAR